MYIEHLKTAFMPSILIRCRENTFFQQDIEHKNMEMHKIKQQILKTSVLQKIINEKKLFKVHCL